MPAGRPTKYEPEMLAITQAYLDSYEAMGHVIPSVVGLAVVLGVAKSTLYEWAKKPENEAFSNMLDAIQDTQHLTLLANGLNNKFNSNIVKLVLSKHGYAEKQQVESVNVNATAPISTDEFKAARKQMLESDDC